MDRSRAFPSPGLGKPRALRGLALLPAVMIALNWSSAARGAPAPPDENAVAERAGVWLGTCDTQRDCTLFGFADDDSVVLTLLLPRVRSPSGMLLLRPDHPLRSDLAHLQFGRRGAVLAVRLASAGAASGHATIDAAATRILTTQLRQTGRLLLVGTPGRAQGRPVVVGAIRPAGASTVLEWIGRIQKRPPIAAAPIERMPPPDPSWPPPPTVLPEGIVALPAVRSCARLDDSTRPGQGTAAFRLSRRTVLWRVPCGSDNFYQNSLFVLDDGAHVAIARFESPAQFPARPPGILVNAELDDAGVLTATEPSRGLEDCGDVRRYRWDGTRFRLLLAQLMPACHGLAVEDWPVVYRAGVIDAPR